MLSPHARAWAGERVCIACTERVARAARASHPRMRARATPRERAPSTRAAARSACAPACGPLVRPLRARPACAAVIVPMQLGLVRRRESSGACCERRAAGGRVGLREGGQARMVLGAQLRPRRVASRGRAGEVGGRAGGRASGRVASRSVARAGGRHGQQRMSAHGMGVVGRGWAWSSMVGRGRASSGAWCAARRWRARARLGELSVKADRSPHMCIFLPPLGCRFCFCPSWRQGRSTSAPALQHARARAAPHSAVGLRGLVNVHRSSRRRVASLPGHASSVARPPRWQDARRPLLPEAPEAPVAARPAC